MVDKVLVSPEALRSYMDDHRYSVRTLCAEVEREMRRTFRKGDPPATCSRATIGHLVTGHRRHCRADRARAIELVLGVRPNTLFLPKIQPDNWFRDHSADPVRG